MVPATTHAMALDRTGDEDQASPLIEALAALMPWALSIVIHLAGFLVLMFFTFVIIRNDATVDVDPFDSRVPGMDSRNTFKDPGLAEGAIGSPIVMPVPFNEGLGNGKNRAMNALGSEKGLIDGSLNPAAPKGPISEDMVIGVPGTGQGPASGGGTDEKGLKFGFANGDPNGGGRGTNLFGNRFEFTGVNRAITVVYVVDSSGSMLKNFDFVKNELIASVSKLAAKQKFAVILFADGPTTELSPGLLYANNPAKKQLKEWMKDRNAGSDRGTTDPSKALERAFKLNPDVIYFLTDGMFDRAVVGQIKKWNAGGKVHIHTIAFVDNVAEAILKEIADVTKGHYLFVTEAELGK